MESPMEATLAEQTLLSAHKMTANIGRYGLHS